MTHNWLNAVTILGVFKADKHFLKLYNYQRNFSFCFISNFTPQALLIFKINDFDGPPLPTLNSGYFWPHPDPNSHAHLFYKYFPLQVISIARVAQGPIQSLPQRLKSKLQNPQGELGSRSQETWTLESSKKWMKTTEAPWGSKLGRCQGLAREVGTTEVKRAVLPDPGAYGGSHSRWEILTVIMA